MFVNENRDIGKITLSVQLSFWLMWVEGINLYLSLGFFVWYISKQANVLYTFLGPGYKEGGLPSWGEGGKW